jgi:hypothetical protein
MADRDKDGIIDTIDIDGGNGTGKPISGTPLADAQKIPSDVAAIINAVISGGGSGNSNKSGTDTSSSKIQLTTNSARAILELAAKDAGYPGSFSAKDIAQFMKEFDDEQALQIEKVVTTTSQNVVSGGSLPGAKDRSTSSSMKTEFPSFFNAGSFTKDWLWKKISFNDEKTLGAKSLGVLADVRGLVDKFQIMGYSDQEAKDAAYLIAKGDKTLDELTVELQGRAIIDYPQFADRFKNNPKLTTYDIASPVINMIAETLEMDPKEVKMNHPVVLAYTRSAGADGKGVAPSYYDLLLKTKQLPEFQKTKQANNEARDSAESLGKALGYGL